MVECSKLDPFRDKGMTTNKAMIKLKRELKDFLPLYIGAIVATASCVELARYVIVYSNRFGWTYYRAFEVFLAVVGLAFVLKAFVDYAKK